MMLRLWNTSILALGMAGGAFGAMGCGQGEISDPEGATDTAVEEALSAVHACQVEARSCSADATATSCEDALRACLSAARADQTDSGERPQREDGGERPQREDGGERAERDGGAGHIDDRDDAEAPSREVRDGAVGREAATPRPNPLDTDGGASLISACVEDLRTCLASAARPSTCATTAITCLSALVRTHKH